MKILKVFDLLTKAGLFFAAIGELLLRFGSIPKSANLADDEDRAELDREYVSQDSLSHGEENEKPAEESASHSGPDRGL